MERKLHVNDGVTRNKHSQIPTRTLFWKQGLFKFIYYILQIVCHKYLLLLKKIRRKNMIFKKWTSLTLHVVRSGGYAKYYGEREGSERKRGRQEQEETRTGNGLEKEEKGTEKQKNHKNERREGRSEEGRKEGERVKGGKEGGRRERGRKEGEREEGRNEGRT